MAQHTPGVDNVVILVGGSPVSNVNPLPTSGGDQTDTDSSLV